MKRFVLILVLALSAVSVLAQTMAVKDKAFYQSKNLTWTDASGASHTNTLADEATDPRHIMALLKEIYTNKTIPGIKIGGYTSDGSREGAADYQVKPAYYASSSGWPTSSNLAAGWNIDGGQYLSQTKDYTPNEEGYTAILIKVKKDYGKSTEDCLSVSSTLKYIAESIESAQVICGTNVDGPNPGTLYELKGDVSRFFILSKGRARQYPNGNGLVRDFPFWGMFEEFSPTALAEGATITDFYARMMQGDLYYVAHDCGSVLDLSHDFKMTADKDVKPLDNVAFYIPNKRLTAWSNRDVQNNLTYKYTNYNPDYAPVLGMYHITLTANGEQAEEDDKWTVTLNWTSNLNTITGCEVPQTYYVYVRNIDGTLDPLLDENGNQVTTENVTTYTYKESKVDYTKAITYVVSGRPKDGSFSLVYSNDDKVVVPPLGKSKWEFTIGVEPLSDYDMMQELNQYKNYVSLFSDIDLASIKKYFDMSVEPKFTVWRHPTCALLGALKVATVDITSTTINGGNIQCSYIVDYANQDGADDTAYPATTGTFTISDKVTIEGLDGFMLQVCDQFNAKTDANIHPGNYGYRVEYSNNQNESIFTPMEEVKVFKTDPETNDQPFTFAYVEGDSIRSAHEYEAPIDMSAPTLTFDTENDNRIYYYKAMMQDAEGTMQEVGRAQRMPSGSYMISGEGQQERVATAGTRTVVNGDDNVFGTYKLAPVVYTFRKGAGNDYNTYGAPIYKVTRLGVEVKEVQLQMSDYTFTDANGVEGRYYKAVLNIPTQGAVLDGEIMRYRVWRVTPDGKAMEVAKQYMPRLNQDSHPADMYVYAGGPVLSPLCKNEFIMGGSPDGETCFPSRYDENTITFTDVFGAKVLASGETMPVTYVVRVYAQPDEASISLPLKAVAVGGGNNEKYYIAENSTVVKFTNSIPTAVMDVDAVAKTPLHVHYVNMLGCTSDTPFEGMNIVVTTFTDGTMMKEKKMY